MQNTEFDEFVRRQQQGASQMASANWEKRRSEWLQSLNRLYSQIESFLDKYISAKQILRRYRTIDLNEEYIGYYKAKQLTLKVGRQEVNFVPIGTMILGARGRVDVVGPTGRVQLLLVDSEASNPSDLIQEEVNFGDKVSKPSKAPREAEWEWKMVTRPPESRFEELTQETFFQLMMEIANG